MYRRIALALVLAQLIIPMEWLHAAPPTTATIVISLKYRYPNFGIVQPATVTVSGPGYYKIIQSKEGIRLTVNRTGYYFIQGEYRYNGITMKASTNVQVKKFGVQLGATLLFRP